MNPTEVKVATLTHTLKNRKKTFLFMEMDQSITKSRNKQRER